jgi:hypothetical protein
MKQIKLILSTILLLLLLTSISYGWVPPPINSPVLLDETDADPWEELTYCTPTPKCYGDNTPNLRIIFLLDGIKLAISYFDIPDFNAAQTVRGNIVSETNLNSDGSNNNGTTEPCRTTNTR